MKRKLAHLVAEYQKARDLAFRFHQPLTALVPLEQKVDRLT